MQDRKCNRPGCNTAGKIRRGMCVRHYRRLLRAGSPLPPVRKLWRNIIVTDACWLWIGPVNNQGYGSDAGRLAHRVVYRLLVAEIPAGLHLDHLCRTRLCVRPDHLEPVTASENKRRAWAAKRVAA